MSTKKFDRFAKNAAEIFSCDADLFVYQAYICLLGRPPDENGLNHYRKQLRNGYAKIDILAQIRFSTEGASRASNIDEIESLIARYERLKRWPLASSIISIGRQINRTKRLFSTAFSNKACAQFRPDLSIALPKPLNNEPQPFSLNMGKANEICSAIRATGLFDEGWYLQAYPDVKAAGLDPLEHYIEHGAFEGRWASPLFHSDYYLNRYHDVQHARVNPLIHYIEHGENEGRRPSSFFDPAWYCKKYGSDATVCGTHLAHFAKFGGIETNPSPFFDALQYYIDSPDVKKAGINPLSHYLSTGIREGRRALPTPELPKAFDAHFATLKSALSKFGRVALFVTYSADGFLRSDILHYIEALVRNDVEVALVIATDQVRNYIPDEIADLCSAVYIRENGGFDFGAWSHALQAQPELLNANTLYLLNDSMIGPTSHADFARVLAAIDEADAEIVGLTQNNAITSHLQSYFLAIKKPVLCSYWFCQYFMDVVNLPSKYDVIFSYELTFASRMAAKGIRWHSLIPGAAGKPDLTIFDWENLLDSGIPFVKRSLIDGEHRDKGNHSVIDALRRRFYPVALIGKRLPDFSEARSFVVAHLRGRGEILFERSIESREIFSAKVAGGDSTINVAFLSPYIYSNGLGMAGRGYAASLMHTRCRYSLHPITKPFHIHSRKAPDWVVRQFHCAPDVAILHLNPDAHGGLLKEEDRYLFESAKRRIGLFVWELSTLPAVWIRGLNSVDAIIAPSEYCASIFRTYTTIPVYVAPHPVPIADRSHSVASDERKRASGLRAKYSIPAKARLILYAFDGSSFLARKNPHALIRAFRKSNLSDDGWHLVLKTKHLFDVPESGQQLTAEIEGDRSITLINDAMPSGELDELFDEVCVYASPHCSEGFGLTIAEAMARGKIVVATDFGGSKDFLDRSCGFPVRADIVSIQEDYGLYQRGGQWASIDENALIDALHDAARESSRVYSSDGLSMSEKAIARIKERLSHSAVARRLEKIIYEVNSAPPYADRTGRLQ